MKPMNRMGRNSLFQRLAIFLALFLFLAQVARAYLPLPGLSLPEPLDTWTFQDTNDWTDANGYDPLSFTNISWCSLGNGSSLVVETNVPAWLDYPLCVTNKALILTNLVVSGPGSITFWYGPNWATANGGPGDWAQLIDVGEWTSDSSYGYWGLSVDPPGSNILFLAQDGVGNSYGLSAPISWTTNFFHFIALTYCSTNVALYIDGNLATNDSGGLSIWPAADALSSGVYFGSDTNGEYQADGLFCTVQTYDSPLDSNTVNQIYGTQVGYFEINMWNIPFDSGSGYGSAISSPSFTPSTNLLAPDVVTGAGFLQSDGADTSCSYSTNAFFVSITNIVTMPSSNGMVNVTFSINGGQSGYFYDVFAISTLPAPSLSSGTWSWMGQGPSCYRYTIPNVNSTDCFIILGTPKDSDGDGLTDAYELLVSHTNPNNPDSNLDGILDGWEILLGLNPQQSNIGNSSQSLNYSYTLADWINGVSGIKGSSSIITDNEGNVTQVSQ